MGVEGWREGVEGGGGSRLLFIHTIVIDTMSRLASMAYFIIMSRLAPVSLRRCYHRQSHKLCFFANAHPTNQSYMETMFYPI